MIISPEQLGKIFIHAWPGAALNYLTIFNRKLPSFWMMTPLRAAAYLAQVGVESGELHNTVENLNYSAEGLVATFPHIFPNIRDPNLYAHDAEKIANCVYANKIGNGDEQSGDGWTYRGRGLIQITGKANYLSCAAALGRPEIMTNPAFLETPEGAVVSSCWFWNSKGLNTYADIGDLLTITKKINGGTNGWNDRLRLYTTAKGVFGVRLYARLGQCSLVSKIL